MNVYIVQFEMRHWAACFYIHRRKTVFMQFPSPSDYGGRKIAPDWFICSFLQTENNINALQ